MTTSTHTYTAWLIGSPDVQLEVTGGGITLDAGAAPHVSASLEIAFPGEAVLEALDPRESARVRIEADAVFPAFTQSRSFDLGLRSRPVRHGDARVSLDLASDEALLVDYAPLADDVGARAYEASLRGVVDYVLGTVIPGASLSSSPSNDADVTRYWSTRNRVQNPSVESTTGYSLGTNASTLATTTPAWIGTLAGRWQSVAAGASILHVTPDGEITPGTPVTAMAHMRCSVSGRTGQVAIRFINDANTVILDSYSAAVTLLNTSTYVEISHTAIAPPGSVRVDMFLVGNASAAAQAFAFDGLMLHDDDERVDYFDGGNAPSGYLTEWNGTGPNVSSNRNPYPIERDKESLTWRAGQSALDFLHPLVQAAGFRLVCDEQRVWTLRNVDYVAPAPSLNIRRGVNMIDAIDTLSRDSDAAWFDAAVTEYIWRDKHGVEQRRLDAYALNTPHTRCVLFSRDTPFPGPGFSQYAVERAQGKGRVVEATRVSLWDTVAEQSCQFVVDGAPTQTGKTDRVSFDLDSDEMTVTARTTDTPDNAINLLTGTINALVGTVNAL